MKKGKASRTSIKDLSPKAGKSAKVRGGTMTYPNPATNPDPSGAISIGQLPKIKTSDLIR